MSATLAQTPQPTTPFAEGGARWMEVVSHIHPRYGGLSSAVPALGLRMAASDQIKISLAAFCSPDERFQPEGYQAGQMSYWPASRGSWLKTSLRRTLADQMADMDGVHIHGLWEQSTAVAAKTARALHKPYIVSAHGMLEPWALRAKRLKKLVYSLMVERRNVAHAACLHALTRAEAEHFSKFGASSPIAIIPNGVDVPAATDSSLFLHRYPELDGKRIVLFLARLHPKKGLDILLDAWAHVSLSCPEAHLVIAGPDFEDTQARLEHFVDRQGLRNSVTFTGMLRDSMKWSALAAAECFVLPSYSEGLSVSVLEAMGMGVPVIVTDCCNMPEVTEHAAGWQITATLKGLTAALFEMFANPTMCNRQLGRNGAALIEARYTWPIVAHHMAELYHWVGGGPKPKSFPIVLP